MREELKPKKKHLLFLVFVAVIIKLAYVIFFPDTGTDKLYQLCATKNYIDGKGISLTYTTIDDLSQNVTEPLYKWPHAYNHLLYYINLLVNDLFTSSIIIELIFSILFIFLLIALLLKLEVDKKSFILGFFFFVFNLTLYEYAGATELISFTLLLLVIYLSLQTIYLQKIKTIDLVISLVLASIAFVKFSYYPIVYVIPIAFFLFGLIKRKKIFFLKGSIYFIVVSLFIFLQSIFLKNYAGQSNLMSSFETGFYLKNLLEFDPFFFNAFINAGYLIKTFDFLFGKTIGSLIILFLTIVLGIVYILFEFKRILKLIKSDRQEETLLSIVGIVLFLVNVGYLALMSLLYSIPLDGNPWTYVEETRYFIPTKIYFQLYFFFMLYKYLKNLAAIKIYNLLRIAFVAFSFVYFTKTILINTPFNTDYQNIKERNEFLHKLQENHTNFVYIDNQRYSIIWAAISHINTLNRHDYQSLINNKFRTSKDIVLAVEIVGEANKRETEFIKRYNAEVVRSNNISKLYLIKLKHGQYDKR